jgi:hypothetical protein
MTSARSSFSGTAEPGRRGRHPEQVLGVAGCHVGSPRPRRTQQQQRIPSRAVQTESKQNCRQSPPEQSLGPFTPTASYRSVVGHDEQLLLLHSLIRPRMTIALTSSRKRKVSAVPNYWWSFVAATAPGVTLSIVGFVAAASACMLVRQSGRGRARTAIAYLCGLSSGLLTTMLFSRLFGWFVEADAIVEPGVFSSFFFPFLGIARAKWQRPRKQARRAAISRVAKNKAARGGRVLTP